MRKLLALTALAGIVSPLAVSTSASAQTYTAYYKFQCAYTPVDPYMTWEQQDLSVVITPNPYQRAWVGVTDATFNQIGWEMENGKAVPFVAHFDNTGNPGDYTETTYPQYSQPVGGFFRVGMYASGNGNISLWLNPDNKWIELASFQSDHSLYLGGVIDACSEASGYGGYGSLTYMPLQSSRFLQSARVPTEAYTARIMGNYSEVFKTKSTASF